MLKLFPRALLLVCTVTAVFLASPAFAQEEFAAEEAIRTAPDLMPLLMRWLHIFAAIVLLGGTIFLRAIVIPATRKGLPEDTAKTVRAVIHARWRKVVPWLILAFLVSGSYNYLAVTRHAHGSGSPYHMLFGIKVLLSLAVFALASMLISTRPGPSKIREHSAKWLLVLIALAVSVVLVAGYLKLMP